MEQRLELKHHGILGMKWHIRRFQNYDGTYTLAGRQRYAVGGTSGKKQKSKEPESKFVKFKGKLTEDVKNQYKDISSKYGRGRDWDDDPIPVVTKDRYTYIPKGANVYRVSTKNEPIDNRRKYVTISEIDKIGYEDMAREGYFDDFKNDRFVNTSYTYKAITDIKIAEGKEVLDYILDKYGSTSVNRANVFREEYNNLPFVTKEAVKNRGGSEQEAKFVDDMHEAYREARHEVGQFLHNKLYGNNKIQDEVIQEFIKRGYDAMVDVEDQITDVADMPLILFNPKNTIEQKSMEPLWTHDPDWT